MEKSTAASTVSDGVAVFRGISDVGGSVGKGRPATAEEETVPTRVRILIANEAQERLDLVAGMITAAGHEVVARLIGPADVIPAIVETSPDMAIVALGEHDDHALQHVAMIVEEAQCPVIVMLERSDVDFVAKAARLGIFGHLDGGGDPEELQSTIEIVLRRFDDLSGLREAFARRILVERAKGVLMERHGIDERAAFDRLRRAARSERARVVVISQRVLDEFVQGLITPVD